MDEALTARGRFRRQRDLRQCIDDFRREVCRVNQLVLGPARMDRDALDVHFGAVGGKRLVNDLAQVRAVEGVSTIGVQVGR